MKQIKEIYDAMLRLSSIGCVEYQYDALGHLFGFGEIHYLVEVNDLFLIAWANNDTGTMVVNPITRFELDELEELSTKEAWTVLHVPIKLTEGIRFRVIDADELCEVYRSTEKRLRAYEASLN
ncbi:hypothetical protein FHW83_006032 [Duganella sp. SG902]|uniref:hypothetical protein n=1 Tax=Duganella sp. SG902 TaxID=2587016 RepID=UPI00159EA0D6|nr:hypothetical protein [Duganella sp. SG902]NVM80187.1 hypothetical protein [Duganella sp. SG902]